MVIFDLGTYAFREHSLLEHTHRGTSEGTGEFILEFKSELPHIPITPFGHLGLQFETDRVSLQYLSTQK